MSPADFVQLIVELFETVAQVEPALCFGLFLDLIILIRKIVVVEGFNLGLNIPRLPKSLPWGHFILLLQVGLLEEFDEGATQFILV